MIRQQRQANYRMMRLLLDHLFVVDVTADDSEQAKHSQIK